MRLITEGDRFFQEIIRLAETAKKSILIETYIFQDFEFGRKICDALCKASQRGVRVRIIYDSFGSTPNPVQLINSLRESGVIVKRYFPASLVSRKLHPVFRFLLTPANHIRWYFYSLYRRDHRKIFLVDNKTIAIGGFNLMKEASYTSMGESRWLDSAIVFKNQNLAVKIRRQFVKTWYDLKKSQIKRLLLRQTKRGEYFSSLERTPALISRSAKLHIQKARQRIWLMFPYFIPPGSWQRLLKKKQKAGVEICVFLPAISDSRIIRLISESMAYKLKKKGVRIFFFEKFRNEKKGRFNHSKLALIDKVVLAGSANLDPRSLFLNLEIMIEFTEKKLVDSLERQFIKIKQSSVEPDLKDLRISWVYYFARPFLFFL